MRSAGPSPAGGGPADPGVSCQQHELDGHAALGIEASVEPVDRPVGGLVGLRLGDGLVAAQLEAQIRNGLHGPVADGGGDVDSRLAAGTAASLSSRDLVARRRPVVPGRLGRPLREDRVRGNARRVAEVTRGVTKHDRRAEQSAGIDRGQVEPQERSVQRPARRLGTNVQEAVIGTVSEGRDLHRLDRRIRLRTGRRRPQEAAEHREHPYTKTSQSRARAGSSPFHVLRLQSVGCKVARAMATDCDRRPRPSIVRFGQVRAEHVQTSHVVEGPSHIRHASETKA